MTFHKFVALLIVLIMVLSQLVGCGGKNTANSQSNNSNQAVNSETDSNSNLTNAEHSEETIDQSTNKTVQTVPGAELTNFVSGYMDAKSVIWNKITEKAASGQDQMANFALLGFAAADMGIAVVPMFDALESTGGVLILTGIKNAFKRKSGNTIEFGYDYVYDADTGNYTKDDQLKCSGLYDMDQGAIKVEMTDLLNKNDSTTHTIIEINKNKDGSYSSQTITYSGSDNPVQGYFTTFKGENLWSAIGEKESNENFDYNSIFGNENVSLDEMTKGFKITTTVSFVDGQSKVVSQ
jgi:hypothetical protein